MVPQQRRQYNEGFTEAKYDDYISRLEALFPGQLEFRVAETPVFVPKGFTRMMLDACDHILAMTATPAYLTQSQASIPDQWRVSGEEGVPQCIAFDFGVCYGEGGELVPQLIEMQGFPSLFCWQVLLASTHQQVFGKPEGFSEWMNGMNRERYVELLKKVIIGDEDAAHVILLEIRPHTQKTRVDFYATEQLLGIQTVCLTELNVEGRSVFYERNGKRTQVKRIYNRVIFDELQQQAEDIQEKGNIFRQDLDVTWVPHPNWFYRLSKFTLPFIKHPNVPQTEFLNRFKPGADLSGYVVKPLFSFAGQGVIIDVTQEAIEAIPDPENWIIQKKVEYAPVVETPDGGAKAEIRLFYFTTPGAEKPIVGYHLSRLSKGKMIGVRYNQNKTWVGGTYCLFEQ